MNPDDFDLTAASMIYGIANTPLFLVRKLKADPCVRAIGEKCSSEQILDVLRKSITAEPKDGTVRPYALLVALWFKAEKGPLEEAAGIAVPDLNWYAYISAALLTTFSPVQTQKIQVQGQLIVSSAEAKCFPATTSRPLFSLSPHEERHQ